MSAYTYSAVVRAPIGEVRERVEAALRDEGFGVLTEIDVAATLKAKLDLDRPPYLILGGCNPVLASRAIDADPSIGALLPCNVVLREGADTSETIVEILDPLAALGIAGDRLAPVAREAADRLQRVMAAVTALALSAA